MMTVRHTTDSNPCSRGVAVGHTQLCHPVQGRTSDHCLCNFSFKASRTHSLTQDHLHPLHGRLDKAPSVIAYFFFPLLSSHSPNPPQVLIAHQSLCFAVSVLPDARPFLRRDRRPRFVLAYRFLAVALVICFIARDLLNLLINLVKQFRHHLAVSEVVGRQDCCHYLASRFINTDVEFAPGARAGVAVLSDLPLPFTKYFHARRINHHLQGLAPSQAGQDNLKRLAPAAEGGINPGPTGPGPKASSTTAASPQSSAGGGDRPPEE